jgi:hypothetical protein
LPDMSAYAEQAEKEKRRKRLERNRASAKLRRLRKKNLVSSLQFEQFVDRFKLPTFLNYFFKRLTPMRLRWAFLNQPSSSYKRTSGGKMTITRHY